jgi:chemotaxis protein histidine kinase CheA
MKLHLGSFTLVGLALCVWTMGARAAGAAGDADAKKLMKTAMEKNYMGGDFELAVKKLRQATELCQAKGCTPSVQAEIYGSLAVVHWVGTEETGTASDDLRAMVKADPKYELDDTYAPPELLEALETIKGGGAKPPAAAPPRAEARPDAGAQAMPKPPASAGAAPVSKQDEFARQVEARKSQLARERDDAVKAAETAEAKRIADEKKAEELRRTQEVEKAAKDKLEAERKAAEEKKAAELRKVEEERKAAEEKKEAERRAIEEKKEAARKAAEEKKEAARRAVEEKKKAAEEKKEAARRAAEEKKAEAERKIAEAAKKAEEERLAKEEARMKKPPPVGKLQETPWRDQTKGYPIPVYVKLPPAPRGIERPRIEVVKVVTEYSSPDMPTPKQFELKALANGAYGGLLPCEASMREGEVTYFTLALNKYENPVAGGGTRAKPNKVNIKPVFTGSFPHLPGEMPPKVCAEDRGGKQASTTEAKANAKAAPTTCQSNAECADGVCTKDGCAPGLAAPPLPTPEPRRGGCAGCQLGSAGSAPAGSAVLAIAAWCAHLLRRRRRDDAA